MVDLVSWVLSCNFSYHSPDLFSRGMAIYFRYKFLPGLTSCRFNSRPRPTSGFARIIRWFSRLVAVEQTFTLRKALSLFLIAIMHSSFKPKVLRLLVRGLFGTICYFNEYIGKVFSRCFTVDVRHSRSNSIEM